MAKRATKTRARASTASRRAAIGQPRVISKQTIISIIRHMLDPNGNRPVV
jgi:hypothetical protein